MSNLTDLYISASYYGVVNLSDATEPFASQSEGRIYLHDGIGEPLGISLDYTKRVSLDNGLTVSGSTLLSGSVQILGDKEITGSLSVSGNITSGDTISSPTGSFDTINARLIHTTIESSSVIYSTGSNILGDEPSDVQTLNGTVNVPNLHYLSGNPKDTNLRIDEKLDTGSFNSFSSSLHTQQGVQDQRLDSIEAFTQSLVADFVTETEYSSSIEQVTSSLYTYIDNQDTTLQNNIDKKLDTGSYQIDSASFDTRIDSKLNTSTFTSFSSSLNTQQNLQDSKLSNLINATSSYARLDIDNNFNGAQTITGSVNGNVEAITITSQTASIDCSLGNFFTVTLPTGSDTHFTATNIIPGQTISVKVVTRLNTTASIDSNSIRMLGSSGYVPSQVTSQDILTFVSFDSSFLYGVAGSFFG